MTISSSQTDIVNQALAELGSTERINSIYDTQSNSAGRAAVLWPMLLRPLLEDHPWNFALRRKQLNEAGTSPLFQWHRQFQLPADLVRWLPSRSDEDHYFDGEREGGFLLTNAQAPLVIRYIAYIDDTSKWPGYFAQVMVYRLAASMAEGVSASKSTRDRMDDKAEMMLARAKRKDGLETGQRRTGRASVRSDILQSRRIPYYHSRR